MRYFKIPVFFIISVFLFYGCTKTFKAGISIGLEDNQSRNYSEIKKEKKAAEQPAVKKYEPEKEYIPSKTILKKEDISKRYKYIPVSKKSLSELKGSDEIIYKPSRETELNNIKKSPPKTMSYEDYIISAEEAERYGDYHKAIESYKKAISIKPINYNLYIKLADLYFMTGDNEKSLKMYESALKLIEE